MWNMKLFMFKTENDSCGPRVPVFRIKDVVDDITPWYDTDKIFVYESNVSAFHAYTGFFYR